MTSDAVVDVVIAGAGPDGLMLACELGLAGTRSVMLDPAPGPDPSARANRIVGQAARILDHRDLYGVLSGSTEPPKPAARWLFAGLPLDLTVVPESELFVVPVQQRGLAEVLTERAADHGADIRWGHALTGFEQDDDGVCVHVAGPDGTYDLTAEYLVGSDGGHSRTRHLAGIDFPGMSSYDLVVRIGFDVLPPDEYLEPRGGAPEADHLPPQRYYRTDRGVFACGAMGSRVAVLTYELDITAREQRTDDHAEEPPMSLAELEASARRVLGSDVPLRTTSPDTALDLRRFFGINSRIASRYQAELARDGRPLVVDLTESGCVAGALSDLVDQLTIAAGRPVETMAATAILVRPDGYVAWASSQSRPDPDELHELRDALARWFGF